MNHSSSYLSVSRAASHAVATVWSSVRAAPPPRRPPPRARHDHVIIRAPQSLLSFQKQFAVPFVSYRDEFAVALNAQLRHRNGVKALTSQV